MVTGGTTTGVKRSIHNILVKNKGDRQVCDNHTGISLLVIAGKVLAIVLLKRLQTHLGDKPQDPPPDKQPSVLPETQCGFKQGKDTVNMLSL